jgi:hypothetical protein
MKRLRNPLVWIGLLLLGLLTWMVTEKVRNVRTKAKIEAISKRYEDVISAIRNENESTGYKFEFYHGNPLLLMVEGPQSEAKAIEIEEALIRKLKTARLLPTKIMYTPGSEDPKNSIAVRVVDILKEN